MSLRISKTLALPDDTITKTLAILAKRRVGKTYAGSVLAEEMVDAGLPFYALDPTGAWWGLRAAANGKDAGLPVVVLGGEHGDVPIDHTAGAAVADLVVDEPGFYVIDLNHIDEVHANTVRFATAFLARLYGRKARNRDPLHGFWDEADIFAPQRPGPDQMKMLGAAEAIVRRGGLRGLGTTVITQRPAVLNKNVLTQIDILVMLRIIGPQDRAAVDEYLKAEADPQRRKEVLESLAGLALGEAWVFAPGEEPEPIYQRIQVRERRTFNSSATPKRGEQRTEPAQLAAVDLAGIRARMADAIERVAADDPKLLRKRVAELEREVREAKQVEPAVAVDKAMAQEFVTAVNALDGMAADIDRVLGEAVATARTLRDDIADRTSALAETAAAVRAALGTRAIAPRRPAPRPPAAAARPAATTTNGNGAVADGTLTKAERSILAVLAQYQTGRTTTQIAILTGYSSKGGGFRNALGSLRTRDFISPARIEPITATAEGITAAGDIDPLPTGRALFDQWLTRLNKAEREILAVLYDAYPGALTADQIAERTESQYAPSGGGFRNALGKLRTLELAEGRGELRASEALFS